MATAPTTAVAAAFAFAMFPKTAVLAAAALLPLLAATLPLAAAALLRLLVSVSMMSARALPFGRRAGRRSRGLLNGRGGLGSIPVFG
jgi:hypothetical protein